MTLREFWNDVADGDIETVWYTSVASPAGVELTHDTDTDDYEDYCDLGEPGTIDDAWLDLEGTAAGGIWQWGGDAAAYDCVGSTLLNLRVFAASTVKRGSGVGQ